METNLILKRMAFFLLMAMIQCQDVKDPKAFNGKTLTPQRVVQRRGEPMSRGRRLHPTNRQSLASKEMEEFESARATEEKREPKNQEDEYDSILKSLLQANDDDAAEKLTKPANTSTSEDSSKEKDLIANETISNNSVIKELLNSIQEKIGTEIASNVVTNHGQTDTVSTSYRLKGIRSLVTPDLLYALAAASEGELILLTTNNFPSSKSTKGNTCEAAGPTVIRAGGLLIHTLLREIMKLVQISSKHVKPITLCKPGKGEPDPTVWEKYKSIVEKADGRSYEFAKLDHGKFLEAARAASVVVMTGEDTEHSSILLTKGRVDGLSSTAQLFSRSTTVPGNSTNQREATSTTPRPSRMKEEPEEPQEQSRVTAKKRSGRGNGEGNEDDDETTVNDLREALEALRNES